MSKTIHDTIAEQLADPEFRSEWEALEPEYQIVTALLTAREETGISQTKLSELTGIAQPDISRIEKGHANPSVRTLERLAKGLGKRLVIAFV